MNTFHRLKWFAALAVLALVIAAGIWFRNGAADDSSEARQSERAEAPGDGAEIVAGGNAPEVHEPVSQIGVDPAGRAIANLKTILEAIEAETDPIRRDELLQLALSDVLPEEMAAVMAALQNYDRTQATTDFGARVMRRWAESDPRAAAGAIASMPPSELRMESLDQVAVVWANLQLCDAATWARRLPDPYERNRALRTVAYETVRTQPVEAIRLAADLLPDAKRNGLLRQAAMEWASREPNLAAGWAWEIPEERLREQVLGDVVTAWGEHDPVAAGTMATVLTGRRQSDAVVSIAQHWVQSDPDSAAAWVEQFPNGALKRTAIESVAAIWTLFDAPRAGQWKGSLQE